MKKLATVFMVLVILFGFVLALTPIIASLLFPDTESTTQMPKEDVARSALARWFNAPIDAFVDVHAIKKTARGKSKSRFSFSTPSGVVRAFIHEKKLMQRELTDEIMLHLFTDKNISWWQPEALKRETWFEGEDQDRHLGLIYNADTKRGVLIIEQED
jgi:hypothetical protein